MKKSDFNKLKAKWYAKLAKSNFKDIEKNEYELIEPSSIFTRTKGRSESSLTEVGWAAKRDYYNMATDFLAVHPFESKIDRIIWEYHANGLSCRDIAATLNKVRKKKTDKTSVWEIVHKLEVIMKKMYLVGFNE